MTKRAFPWPTKPGYYLVHNATEVAVGNGIESIWRIELMVNPADGDGLGGYWRGRWYPDGLYVDTGEHLAAVQAHFTLDGKPWAGLAFRGPLPLAQIAALYDGGQC